MNAVQPALKPRPSDQGVHLHQGSFMTMLDGQRQRKVRAESRMSLLIEIDTAGSDDERPEERVSKTQPFPEGGVSEILYLVSPNGCGMKLLPGCPREECHRALMQVLLLEWMPVDQRGWDTTQNCESGDAKGAESVRQVGKGSRGGSTHDAAARLSNVARGAPKAQSCVLINGSWISGKAEVAPEFATEPRAAGLNRATAGAVSWHPPG